MSTQAFKITTLVATLFFSAIGCSTAFAKKPPQTPKQTVNLNAVTDLTSIGTLFAFLFLVLSFVFSDFKFIFDC